MDKNPNKFEKGSNLNLVYIPYIDEEQDTVSIDSPNDVEVFFAL